MSIKEDFMALDRSKIEQAREMENKKKQEDSAENTQNGVMARLRSLLFAAASDEPLDLSMFSSEEIQLLESIQDLSEVQLDEDGKLVRIPHSDDAAGKSAANPTEESVAQLSAIRDALARTREARKRHYDSDKDMVLVRLETAQATSSEVYISAKQLHGQVVGTAVGREGFGPARKVWVMSESGNRMEDVICQLGYSVLSRSCNGFITELTIFAPVLPAWTLSSYMWGNAETEDADDPVRRAYLAMVAQAKLTGLQVKIVPSQCATESAQSMADAICQECFCELFSKDIVEQAQQAEKILEESTQSLIGADQNQAPKS